MKQIKPLKRAIISILVLWALLAACSLTRSTGLAPSVGNQNTPGEPGGQVQKTSTSLPRRTVTLQATRLPSATPAVVQEAVEKIPAPSLEGNLLGDEAEQSVQVYLPPSYATSEKRYPVVYFLPGFGSDPNGNNSYFSPEALAAAMSSGEIMEMILVVPNGANALHGSFYVNSPVTGNWEDFIIEDVLGYIDENYRTIASRDGRGIAGFSMGGFAAIDLAMRHPDLFAAAYGLSPALFAPDGLKNPLLFDSEEKERAMLAIVEELSKLPQDKALKQMIRSEGHVGFTLAYGTAFAGSPELKPPYFSLPFEERNGKLKRIPKEWERWQNGFGGWEAKIAEHHDDLASLKGLVIDYGSSDLDWIITGSQYVAKALEAAGIPHRLLSYEGTHGSQVEQRVIKVMLPFFSGILQEVE
jgi:S-formylglutathione hydrolase